VLGGLNTRILNTKCECAFSMLPSKAICKVHGIEDQYPNFNKTGDENKRRDYLIRKGKNWKLKLDFWPKKVSQFGDFFQKLSKISGIHTCK